MLAEKFIVECEAIALARGLAPTACESLRVSISFWNHRMNRDEAKDLNFGFIFNEHSLLLH